MYRILVGLIQRVPYTSHLISYFVSILYYHSTFVKANISALLLTSFPTSFGCYQIFHLCPFVCVFQDLN